LSPGSLWAVPAGTKLILPSPNGSRLSLAGGNKPVLAGWSSTSTPAIRISLKLQRAVISAPAKLTSSKRARQGNVLETRSGKVAADKAPVPFGVDPAFEHTCAEAFAFRPGTHVGPESGAVRANSDQGHACAGIANDGVQRAKPAGVSVVEGGSVGTVQSLEQCLGIKSSRRHRFQRRQTLPGRCLGSGFLRRQSGRAEVIGAGDRRTAMNRDAFWCSLDHGRIPGAIEEGIVECEPMRHLPEQPYCFGRRGAAI